MTVRHLELKLHRKDSIRTGMTFLGPAPQAPKPPTTELPRAPAGGVPRSEWAGRHGCSEATQVYERMGMVRRARERGE